MEKSGASWYMGQVGSVHCFFTKPIIAQEIFFTVIYVFKSNYLP